MISLNIEQTNDIFESKKYDNILLVHIKNYCDFLFGKTRGNVSVTAFLDYLFYESDTPVVIFYGNTEPLDNGGYSKEFNQWSDIRRQSSTVFDLCNEFDQLLVGSVKSDKIFISCFSGCVDFISFAFSLACDYRIVSDGCLVRSPKTKLDLVMRDSGEYFLSRILGPLKTIELIDKEDDANAEQLFSLKLVDRIVPQGELVCNSIRYAKEIASKQPSERQRLKRCPPQHLIEYLEFKNKRFMKYLSNKQAEQ